MYWTSLSVGCDAPKQTPMAAKEGRHKYGNEHVANIPPASHAVGARPGSVAQRQIKGRLSPARERDNAINLARVFQFIIMAICLKDSWIRR
ncbi:hypothetical protein PoB_003717900 [Plakobranchus ocellatus]|uniref:Uncharacterized protein n=1 Tax=Plakobranchus ocellatus TaxID=259542 RepID=A0AAV4AWB2_9GAST|nr:hypothetical protein PoB_003717900 [Plakobranchus ocellatus]